jgi:hypothetical protein
MVNEVSTEMLEKELTGTSPFSVLKLSVRSESLVSPDFRAPRYSFRTRKLECIEDD